VDEFLENKFIYCHYKNAKHILQKEKEKKKKKKEEHSFNSSS
jgi:hypothetical protein